MFFFLKGFLCSVWVLLGGGGGATMGRCAIEWSAAHLAARCEVGDAKGETVTWFGSWRPAAGEGMQLVNWTGFGPLMVSLTEALVILQSPLWQSDRNGGFSKWRHFWIDFFLFLFCLEVYLIY